MSLANGDGVSETTVTTTTTTERVDPAPPPLMPEERNPRQAGFVGGLALVLLLVALAFAMTVPLAGRLFG